MREYEYFRPDSVEEAVRLLGTYGKKAYISAGGTDLVGTLRNEIHAESPEAVISLRDIPGLREITGTEQGWRIGAMTTLETVAEDAQIRKALPMLAEAARSVASLQIRNVATVGGNLCQEPRCWYYRYPGNRFYCFRKGGEECPALNGNNKIHSIYGAARVCDSPCTQGCPNHTDIPGYMEKLRAGDVAGAAEILFRVNPIAALTGRVCTHSCEKECSRGTYDSNVSIRNAERFLGDYLLEHAEEYYRTDWPASGKKAAVIGAGPSGLTAAFFLAKAGHAVTVYDQNAEAGGMLTYGIPAYRLPKDLVAATVQAIRGMGVNFVQNCQIGKDILLADLLDQNDAVYAAIGAWRSASPRCENEDAPGVLRGIAFLHQIAEHKAVDLGKRVIVVGGGSVAMDVALSAKRSGAAQVTVITLEKADELPADPDEVLCAKEEGIAFVHSFGTDRVLVREDGRACGLRMKACVSVFDENGRFAPAYDESITQELEADTIIFAIGQGIDTSGLEDAAGGRGIQADHDTFQTAVPGLFAGGDGAFGPTTVVRGIADGRQAAACMHAFLTGADPAEETGAAETVCTAAGSSPEGTACTAVGSSPEGTACTAAAADQKGPAAHRPFDPACLSASEPLRILGKAVPERTLYEEDTQSPAEDAVRKEASRCYNCGCVAGNPSDLAPALTALHAVMQTSRRAIPAEEFFRAGVCAGTVLAEDEILLYVDIPSPAADAVQQYVKFRIRQSIDFPIVSLASVFRKDGNVIAEASLVLNAVYPVPVRLKAVEQFLAGKTPSEETAKEAAALAVENTIPLEDNRYKINVTRALMRRAVAGLI